MTASCRSCGKEIPASFEFCTDCLVESVRQSLPPHKPRIKQNRFGGDLIEYGAITALFEDMPMSEIGVTSGAQVAFNAAKEFITEMVENQCKLAGCFLAGQPYGSGDVHTEKCWFTKRAMFYEARRKASETV